MRREGFQLFALCEPRNLKLYGKDACPGPQSPQSGIGVRMVSEIMVGMARGVG